MKRDCDSEDDIDTGGTEAIASNASPKRQRRGGEGEGKDSPEGKVAETGAAARGTAAVASLFPPSVNAAAAFPSMAFGSSSFGVPQPSMPISLDLQGGLLESLIRQRQMDAGGGGGAAATTNLAQHLHQQQTGNADYLILRLAMAQQQQLQQDQQIARLAVLQPSTSEQQMIRDYALLANASQQGPFLDAHALALASRVAGSAGGGSGMDFQQQQQAMAAQRHGFLPLLSSSQAPSSSSTVPYAASIGGISSQSMMNVALQQQQALITRLLASASTLPPLNVAASASSDTASAAARGTTFERGGSGGPLAGSSSGVEISSVPGRRVVPVSLGNDRDTLSEYQCVLREQIYLFEASRADIEATAQGRNKPIQIGQVGIQCRHCSHLPPGHRARGSVYFPAKLSGIYQAAQNMAINHFNGSCHCVPELTRARLLALKAKKTFVLGGGKQYWANAAGIVGIVEGEDGLSFRSSDPDDDAENADAAEAAAPGESSSSASSESSSDDSDRKTSKKKKAATDSGKYN